MPRKPGLKKAHSLDSVSMTQRARVWGDGDGKCWYSVITDVHQEERLLICTSGGIKNPFPYSWLCKCNVSVRLTGGGDGKAGTSRNHRE